jgi:hypothetical protein
MVFMSLLTSIIQYLAYLGFVVHSQTFELEDFHSKANDINPRSSSDPVFVAISSPFCGFFIHS